MTEPPRHVVDLFHRLRRQQMDAPVPGTRSNHAAIASAILRSPGPTDGIANPDKPRPFGRVLVIPCETSRPPTPPQRPGDSWRAATEHG